MPTDANLSVLRTAVKGLTYESETDAPLEVFKWSAEEIGKTMTGEKILEKTGAEPGAIEEQSVQEFFAPLVKSEDWHREEERKTVKRFKALLTILNASLSNIGVFKFGNTEKSIYVVGKDKNGDWVGLKTAAAET